MNSGRQHRSGKKGRHAQRTRIICRHDRKENFCGGLLARWKAWLSALQRKLIPVVGARRQSESVMTEPRAGQKTKPHPLNKEQKPGNRISSLKNVLIEDAFRKLSKLKIFRILKERKQKQTLHPTLRCPP